MEIELLHYSPMWMDPKLKELKLKENTISVHSEDLVVSYSLRVFYHINFCTNYGYRFSPPPQTHILTRIYC